MQHQSRWFSFFLATITALTSLAIDMSLPAVPAIERNFGVAAGHGSLTLSLFLAGFAVTPLVGGPLADRFGRRAVLLVSIAAFALMSLACVAAPGFQSLLWFRIVQGCASGVAVSLPLAIVRDLFESHQARQRIAEVTTINGLMPLVAPLFGSWVMLLGSWRWIFAMQGIFASAVVLVVLLWFKESLPDDHRQALHPSHLFRNYARIFSNRNFMTYALIYALNFACLFSFISVSPLILMQSMHVARSTYTHLFALTVTGTILGSFASSRLNRSERAPHRLVRGALVTMTLACVVAALLQRFGMHRPVAILPLIFVVLFCFGLTSPAITLQALETLPQLAGSGSGAIRSLQMVFGSAASSFLAVFCALPSVYPATAATSTMALMAFGSLLLFLSLPAQHAVSHPQPS